MQIFDSNFKELFQNSALSIQVAYYLKMALFALRNTWFDVLVIKTILKGLYYLYPKDYIKSVKNPFLNLKVNNLYHTLAK